MLLVELITPRAEPKIAQTKDILSTSGSQYLTFKKLSAFLIQNGFVYLGEGVGGIVFERPGYPWVFKVFRNDPAYFHFLKYAIAHQDNPNLPRIKGKFIKLGDGAYAVRMEKLKPLAHNDRLAHPTIGYQYRQLDAIPEETVKIFSHDYPGIWRALKDTVQPGFILDLGHGNIMQRDGVPVVIDPWVKSL